MANDGRFVFRYFRATLYFAENTAIILPTNNREEDDGANNERCKSQSD